MDILTILETAAKEIRDLRSQAVSNQLMMQNITLRLAIHQIGHGLIHYQWHVNQPGLWDKLLALIEANRLMITSSGEVYLDRQELTRELLDSVNQE